MANSPRLVLACALALAVTITAFALAVVLSPLILFALWG
jgi:hypothetical protein